MRRATRQLRRILCAGLVAVPLVAGAQEIGFWRIDKVIVEGDPQQQAVTAVTRNGAALLRAGDTLQSTFSFKLPKGVTLELRSNGEALKLEGDDQVITVADHLTQKGGSLAGGRMGIVNRLPTPFTASFHRYIARDVRTEYDVAISRDPALTGTHGVSFCVTVKEGAVEILRLPRPPETVETLALLVGADLAHRWPGHRHAACFPLNEASTLDHFQSLGDAELAYRAAIDEAKASADPQRIARAWIELTRFLHEVGRYETVIAEYEAALRDERIAGVDRFWILNNLGIAYLRAGDLMAALARHAEAKQAAAALSWLRRTDPSASNLINTGNVLLESDRIDAAIESYRDAVALLEHVPWLRARLAQARMALAAGHFAAGQRCEAKTQLSLAASEVSPSRGCASEDVLVDRNFAALHIAQRQYAEATRALSSAQDKQKQYCSGSLHVRFADIAETWGDLRTASSEFDAAAAKYREALELRELLASRAHNALASLRIKLAGVALSQSKLDAASKYLRAAESLLAARAASGVNQPLLSADLMQAEARLHMLKGEPELARSKLEAAYRLRKDVLGERPHQALEDTLVALKAVSQQLAGDAAAATYEARIASLRSAPVAVCP